MPSNEELTKEQSCIIFFLSFIFMLFSIFVITQMDSKKNMDDFVENSRRQKQERVNADALKMKRALDSIKSEGNW